MTYEEALDKLNRQKECFQKSGLVNYGSLCDIFIEHAGLENETLDLFRQALEKSPVIGVDVASGLGDLRRAAVQEPEKAEKIFSFIRDFISSGKNDDAVRPFMYAFYGSAQKIIENNPALSDEVFKTFKHALSSNLNSQNFAVVACSHLINIFNSHPQFGAQITDVLSKSFQSETNDSRVLIEKYIILGKIAEKEPRFSSDVIKAFEAGLKRRENTYTTQEKALGILVETAKRRPDLVRDVLTCVWQYLRANVSDSHNKDKQHVLLNILDRQEVKEDLSDKEIKCYKIRMKANPSEEYADTYIKVAGTTIVEQVSEKVIRNVNDTIVTDDYDFLQLKHYLLKNAHEAPYWVGQEFSEDMITGRMKTKDNRVYSDLEVRPTPVSRAEYERFKRRAKRQNENLEELVKYDVQNISSAVKVSEDVLEQKMEKMKEKLSDHGLEIGKTADKKRHVGKIHEKTAAYQVEVAQEFMQKRCSGTEK